MARYKPYDYRQQMIVAVSLEDQLSPGTLEYAIHVLIEKQVDTGRFDERYCNDETGRIAYDPKVLLKIVLLAYARGMLHSRPIERACKENVTFMALACGQTPDHSTIASFISSLGEEQVVDLFTQVLLICEQEGLLGGTHFSLDGLKLPSNASKEWSGKHAELRKKQKKLAWKVKEAVREHREKDRRGGDADGRRREKRIERLKRNARRIEKFLARNEPKAGKRGKEVQSNVTDNESAKMVSSHGVVQGYNANAVVDEESQVVVHPEVFGDGEDSNHAGPMLEGARKNLEAVGREEPLKGVTFSADSSYFSIENLEACKEHEVDAYIPDRNFRKRDPRFAEAQRHRRSVDKQKKRYKSKKQWFTVEDFHYDDRLGKLICPAGEQMYLNGRREYPNGYRAVSYRATKRACSSCHLRAKCMRNPEGQSRQVNLIYGRRPGSLTDAMKAKIDTPQGRRTYSKRLGIVEPVFGNIRAQKGMDRFTLRGRKKVNVQWMLYCLVHNIGKIAIYGTSYATVV
jgi:transposase